VKKKKREITVETHLADGVAGEKKVIN